MQLSRRASQHRNNTAQCYGLGDCFSKAGLYGIGVFVIIVLLYAFVLGLPDSALGWGVLGAVSVGGYLFTYHAAQKNVELSAEHSGSELR